MNERKKESRKENRFSALMRETIEIMSEGMKYRSGPF